MRSKISAVVLGLLLVAALSWSAEAGAPAKVVIGHPVGQSSLMGDQGLHQVDQRGPWRGEDSRKEGSPRVQVLRL